MRDVAIIATAQTKHVRAATATNEVELIQPVIQEVIEKSGVGRHDIDFTCSGSSDYLAGQPFSFVMTLDAVGAWPPISESHVEMDGAWALYEAWVKIQTGHADTALVYSYGKSSPGDLPRVLSRMIDPYYEAPLWPDSIDIAALQARAAIDAGVTSEAEMADIAHRSRTAAEGNPYAQLQGSPEPSTSCSATTYLSNPLRRHDCAPITDGGVAIVLAAGDKARELSSTPGLDPWHRPPRRRAPPELPRPDRRTVGLDRRREGGRGQRSDRRRRAARPLHPPGGDPARRARSRRRRGRQPVGRCRSRPTR